MIPVLKDNSPENVLELGGLLARVGDGKLLVMNRAAKDLTLKKRREKLKSEVLKDPETEVDLHHRIEKINPDGIINEAVESEASLILLDLTQGNRREGRIFDELVDGVIWETKTPVIAARLKVNIKALERVVLVVAANTVGVKYDDRSTEAALDIAKALDLPLLVMYTDHYFESLQKRIEREKSEKHRQIVLVSTDDENGLVEQIYEADLVLVPSMGSQNRFTASAEHLPYKLLRRLDGSLAVIHFL